MDKNIKKIKKAWGLILIGAAIALGAILISVFSSWVLYSRTSQILDTNLRERLLSIVTTAVVQFDYRDVEQLRVEEDWKKPEWAKVVHQMENIRKNNSNIVFIYIFRKTDADPTKMEFVSDSHSIDPYAKIDLNNDGVIDDEDQLQWPGQPYDVSDIPETFVAYNGPTTNKEMYTDKWGSFLTGYAPIKNENGDVVAVLAVDIKAGDFAIITTQTLFPFLVFVEVLTLIIAILAFTLIFIWERRAYVLAKISRELEIANRQQEILLHFISHEIKAYMTKAEGGFAELGQGDFGDIPSPLQIAATNHLADAREGVATVMTILDSANLKKGTVSYARVRFNFKDLLLASLESARGALNEKNLKLETEIADGTYEMEGDKEKIEKHVIRNIIDNAVRYSSSGTIRVRLSDGGGKIRLSVVDNGVGITPEDMQNLFTEGGHGKNSLKFNVHSTGYGLFVAKQVTDAHGGKIWAESEGAGKGATFTVEIPAAA